MRRKGKSGIVVRQFDDYFIDIEACTCEPFFVMDHAHRNIFCPIDRHAQAARQQVWEFDDHGNIVLGADEYDDSQF